MLTRLYRIAAVVYDVYVYWTLPSERFGKTTVAVCAYIYTPLTLILPQGAPPVAAALLIAINVKYLIKFKCSPAG